MTASAPSSRLGRTALLVHLLALAGAAAWLFLPKVNPHEKLWYAFAGVGCAVAVVFGLWSCVLAVRAFKAGERWRWPYAVLALTAAEVSGVFIAYGVRMMRYNDRDSMAEIMWEAGLPVIVPFVLLGMSLASGVAMWRFRRAQKTFSDARRLRRTARMASALTWIVWALLCIPALHLFCSGTEELPIESPEIRVFFNYCFGQSTPRRSGWQLWVCEHTPDFVRDGVQSFFSGIERIDCNLRVNGAVSERRQRLLAEDANPVVVAQAIQGMSRNTKLYHEHMVKVGDGKLNASKLWHPASVFVAQWGTPDEIEHFLSIPAKSPADFMAQFYMERNYIDARSTAERLKEHLRSSNDPVVRLRALDIALENIDNHKLNAECCEIAIKDPDSTVRINALVAALPKRYLNGHTGLLPEEKTYPLALKDLSTNDLALRRKLVHSITSPDWSLKFTSTPDPESNAPETAAEKADVEKARKWLQEWVDALHRSSPAL